MKPYMEPLLLFTGLIVGALTGLFTDWSFPLVDAFLVAMLFFLFYGISFDKLLHGAKNKKYLSVAWMANFVIIPLLAFLLASLFVDRASAVFIGLIIYLVAPCTDWFLGFTKIAKGDVEANSALLPINLFSQLVLLPVYLFLFTTSTVSVQFSSFIDVLFFWIILPFIAAQILRLLISRFKKGFLEQSFTIAENGMVVALALLVFALFNMNIESLIANIHLVPVIFAVILIYCVVVYFLMKYLAHAFRLNKKEKVSLTVTAVARNSPLMLGISLALFPTETVIHLVLILGMLVEVPNLIILTQILKK